ncbi:hypothetical protein GCM10010994_23870 [Chelatococcus reniformis]|uniref:Uncharacterized protein n=1 Tax=Chelatococcus reniformis TaxID=1494448 RepID=A0A916U9V8_9HYPH|nr:hypothetical protein GCM10010994_23870 [Chelatococcus reniformis]
MHNPDGRARYPRASELDGQAGLDRSGAQLRWNGGIDPVGPHGIPMLPFERNGR